MLEVLIGLIVVPTALICGWNWVLVRMNPYVWDIYRYTGLVGTPLHELSHALTCLVFKMRIHKIALYAPNALTGTLGFVRFSYRPHSPLHAMGRLFQGVAPMITGSFLMIWLLDLGDALGSPLNASLLSWIWGSAVATANNAGELFVSGWQGALLVTWLAVVALHLIPSVSDIQISLAGLAGVLFVVAVFLLALDFVQANAVAFGIANVAKVDLAHYLGAMLDFVERALWMGVLGVTATMVMAFCGSMMVVVVPAVIWYARDFVRGARGSL